MSHDDGHHHGDMPQWMHVLLLVLVAVFVILAVVTGCLDHARHTAGDRTESVR